MKNITILSSSGPLSVASSSSVSLPVTRDHNTCEDWNVTELRQLATEKGLSGRSKWKTKSQLCRGLHILSRPRPCLLKSGKRNHAWSVKELHSLATERKIKGRSQLRTKKQLCLKLMRKVVPQSWIRQQVENHVFNIEAKAQKIWSGMRKSNKLLTLRGSTWLNDEVINQYGTILINKSQRFFEPKSKCLAFSSLSIFAAPNTQAKSQAEIQKLYTAKKSSGQFRRMPSLERIRPRYLLFPCNQNSSHWTLYVVDLKLHEIHFYDSLKGKMQKGHQKTAEDHASVLFYRLHSKKRAAAAAAPREWTFVTAQSNHHQGNMVDCGVHVCILMRLINLGLTEDIGNTIYASSETPFYRAMIAYEIAHQKLIRIG